MSRAAQYVFSASDGSMLHAVHGNWGRSQFGRSLSRAGDVNADGLGDFIVGGPIADDELGASSAVVVYSGRDGSALHTFQGGYFDWGLGSAVGGVGDINGDGRDDFAIAGGAERTVRIYSGGDGALLRVLDDGSISFGLGTSLTGQADVDGDGSRDVLVGVSNSVRIFSGADGARLRTLRAPADFIEFGASIGVLGDVNGDGLDDFIVGAPGENTSFNEPSQVQVFSGADGSALYTLSDDSPTDNLGAAVSTAGDVNGDGRADFLVGIPKRWNVSGAGRVQLLSGADGNVLYTVVGDSPSFGQAVGDVGDANGDGISDFVVGAPRANSATLFSGADGTPLYTLRGDVHGDEFGDSVAAAGDWDSDGRADILVGALAPRPRWAATQAWCASSRAAKSPCC